jgi:TonB family protein
MAQSDLLRNLMAAAIQMAIFAAFAEVLLRALPVAAAGFRYAYWRLVLVGALLLPWLLRATPPPAIASAAPAASLPGTPLPPLADVAGVVTDSGAGWLPWLPWLIAAGTCLRLLWVAGGIIRLRAARRCGVPVDDVVYDDIQERLRTCASIRSVPGIGQPVTFGLWRPVVLLPVALERADETIRRAAVAHELIHVQRRDWLFVLVEEMLRAVLWFHPAIWWMTARIRLTREEFTDHLAVLATGSRRSYIDALLAFADAAHVAPAPAFISRAHLFHRIVLLTKEPAMSSRRIAICGIVLTSLLGAGGWYASEAFPVRVSPASMAVTTPPAAPQQGPTSAAAVPRPVTTENPIPRRLFATPIPYPLELAGTGYEAALSIRVVVNEAGLVESATAGARAVASPRRPPAFPESEAMERFAADATEAISRWQYAPPARAPIAFYLAVVFKAGAAAVVSESEQPQGVHAGATGARMTTPAELAAMQERAARARAASAASGTRSGGPFAPSASTAGGRPPAVNPAAGRGLQETITVTAETPGVARGPGARGGGAGASSSPGAGAARSETPQVRPDGGPVRVGGNVTAPTQVRKVDPVYPEEAKAARVQGVVILEATISDQGRVDSVRVLRSIPLLDQAAIDAVRQWEYTPTLLNGLPVPVIMTTTVLFRLDP